MDQLTDYEMVIANHLVDPNDIKISWNNIAGLDSVIQELKETVILPIQRKELFEDSQLTQAPKVLVVLILQEKLIVKYTSCLSLSGSIVIWSTRLWKNYDRQSYCPGSKNTLYKS